MQYIILDMEWNQAQTPEQVIREPVHLVGEIVQMGAVKLDDNMRCTDTFKIYITPCYYKKMNWRIAKLTGISNDDLRNGCSFQEALDRFYDWCGDDFCFITWGGDDIPMLRDNMQLHGMDCSNIPTFYNVQPIFDYQITKENRQCSLTYAMEKLGETPYKEHDALNDALNTAVVCAHLDMKSGIEQYEMFKKSHRKPPEEKSGDVFRKYFLSRRAALSDGECKRIKCTQCSNNSLCGNWLHQSGDKYISLASCSCGKEYFVRLIIRKNGDSSVRISRTVYPLDEQHREYYTSMAEKNKHRKKHRYSHAKKLSRTGNV